ncbi:MAG: hypothetical protein K2G60_04090, partial [Oscillospiraceae bacterium]|nr:hypothetical protein [Oscillospiraceae bacterium]
TSCGIKNSKKDANTPSDKNSAHLDSSDLPTVTDKNGNAVDYSANITEPEDDKDVSSPYLSVGSLKDINSKAGTNIKSPGGLKISNEEFDLDDTVSPKVASYSFTVSGTDYTIAASRKTGGMLINLYLSDGTYIGEGLEGTQSLSPAKYDSFCVARWFDDGVQYNLYAENVELSEFKAVYSKVK